MSAAAGRLRILYVIVDLEIGGTERALVRLVTHLDRSRFEPVVVALKREGPLGHDVEAAGIRLVNFKLRGEWDARGIWMLLDLILRFRPHVIHGWLVHANVLSRVAGRLAGVPRILTSLRTMEGRPYYWPLERVTWPLGDEVVCASEAVRAFAAAKAGVRRAEVIYSGVPEPVALRPGIETELRLKGCAIVATAARLAPGKGSLTFLRTARVLAPRFPQARFAILGGGELEGALRDMAQESGIEDRVHFLGWRDDVSRALKGATVFVHASRLGEGLPNAVLEAMIAGVPVVATDVGGTREAVAEGETGFLVPRQDPELIAERVGRLLEDPALARSMGAKGLERARERFSIEAMVAAYQALYERASASSPPPTSSIIPAGRTAVRP